MPGLETCPSCDSGLVQPLGSSRGKDGKLALKLRCPECETRIHVVATDEQVCQFEDILDDGREALERAYKRCVADSMEALADCLERALALDLLSADDFGRRAVPRAARA